MRKRVLAILSGVAIVASTLALVPDEAAAQEEEEASGVAADLEAGIWRRWLPGRRIWRWRI